MKKSAFVLGISILFSVFSSCFTIEETPLFTEEEVKTVSFTISTLKEEVGSSCVDGILKDKAKQYWESGDAVGVFLSNAEQVNFQMKGADGKTTASFASEGMGLKLDNRFSAYYPYSSSNNDARMLLLSYLGQKQQGTGELASKHLGSYTLMASPPVTATGPTLSFTLNNVGAVMMLHLTMPKASVYTSAVLYTDAKVIPVRKAIDLQDAALTQSSIELSDRLAIELQDVTTQTPNEELILWIAFPAVAEAAHTLKVVVYDDSGNAYSADVYKTDQVTVSDLVFKENTSYCRYATPVKIEGFNFSIEQWESDGQDHGGSVNKS
jgi:hypothetical protein